MSFNIFSEKDLSNNSFVLEEIPTKYGGETKGYWDEYGYCW
jgi:hypothetical protein